MSQSTRKSNPSEQDGPQIIQEKIVKVNGDVAIRKYSKNKFLGKGGFARVYEFQNLETNKISAAKIVTKSSLTKSRAKQKLMSEIKIHRSLHQNNIVGFEHFFEDNENVYILLELCQNQTMNEMLRRRKRLTEIEVQCYIQQVISAMKYMHQYRVIHRDLKLGNLFLNEKMEIKIGDFGLATKLEFEGEKKRTICGTPNYIAPEVLDGKQGHSYEVDIWSLGVILFTLLIGKPPFETSDVKTTYRRIRMNAYTFPEHVSISDQAKSLITRILNGDPSRRPNLDEIINHEFFHQGWLIPKVMPVSTLACPPSSSFLKQYMTNTKGQQPAQPLMATTPVIQSENKKSALLSTERIQTAKGETPRSDLKSSSSRQDQMAKSARPTVKSAASSNTAEPSPQNPEDVWVKKWVDYSSKYGLGYLLSNGATGVFFNDSSKIILDPSQQVFNYIERRSSDKQDIVTTKRFDDSSPEMQKKITLLKHFKNYLEGEKQNDIQVDPNIPLEVRSPYVKKWMRTKHAIMFRLSNKIVQVNFQDHTEIILSSETKVVTYVNKKGERQSYPLSSALESQNTEMSKRLKYTKDILTHMLSAGGKEINLGTVKNNQN